MTKHNAEMENSREQSRVCARLPLNLQLFAEDTGENGADTNAEGAAGDTDANSDGGNTTPTFDELLKGKKSQSEFDSRVRKALAPARAKWEESAKEQADEAKKLSSMNKEERERYNLAKDRQAFEQEKAAFAKKQLETAVAAELLQRKLPVQFAAILRPLPRKGTWRFLAPHFKRQYRPPQPPTCGARTCRRQVRKQRATMYRPQTSAPMRRGENRTANRRNKKCRIRF